MIKLLILAFFASSQLVAMQQRPLTPFQALKTTVVHDDTARCYTRDAYECAGVFRDRDYWGRREDVAANCQYLSLLALFGGDKRGPAISGHEMARVFKCTPREAEKMPEFVYMNLVREHGQPSFRSPAFLLKRQILAKYRAQAKKELKSNRA